MIALARAVRERLVTRPPDRAGRPRAARRGRSAAAGRARCAAASSASSPAGISRTRWASSVEARRRRPRPDRCVSTPQRALRGSSASSSRADEPPQRGRAAADRDRDVDRPAGRCPSSTPRGVRRAPPRARPATAGRRPGRRRPGSREPNANDAAPLDAAGERADRDLGRAAADVDHRRRRPAAARAERARGAEEGQPRLLLAVEHARPRRRRARGSPRRTRRGWRRARIDGRGDRADRSRADLLGQRVLLGDDARGLGDPRRRDLAARRQPAAQAGERAPLQDLAQAARRAPRRPARAWCSSRCRCSRRACAPQRCCHDGSDDERRPAIEVHGLRKAYGLTQARARASTSPSRRGEVFGLLGPNGAGKTTTVEILEGYRARDGGDGLACSGYDPGERSARAARARRDRPAELRHLPAPDRRARPSRTGRRSTPRPRDVERGARARRASTSAPTGARGRSRGGQAAAAGLRARAGRRPRADLPRRADHRLRPRRPARRVGRRSARCATSARPSLLTTHYLDEAQALADRVAILKDGRILAEGPPDSLGASRYRVAWRAADGDARGALHRGPDGAAARADRRGARARRAARGAQRHPARASRTSTSS